MGDPTPRDPLGNARTLRNLLERVRKLETARPLQTAFNDASAAQSSATSAQSTASGALGVAQGASFDASAAAQQAQAAQQAAAAKTKTTWSTSIPDNVQNPGTADGDTWYVTNGTGGNTTAQYRWSAATLSWTLTPIDGAVLRNVVADTVKAGAVDGKTITGATIRSAASGKRLELLGTRLDVYSDGAAVAASIEGVVYSSASYGGLLLKANGPSGAGTCVIYTPVSTSLSGPWSGTATVSANISNGLATPDMVVRRVFAGQSSATDTPKMPIIESDSNGASDDGTAAGTRFYGNRYSWIDPYGRSPGVVDIIKPVYARSNGVLPLAKVVVSASDFQTLDGVSVTADTDWIPLTAQVNGYTSDQNLAVRLVGKEVEMRGQVKLTGGGAIGGASGVINLPAQFRPTQAKNKLSACQGTAYTKVVVQTSGNVDWTAPSATAAYVAFDDVKFMIG